MRRYAVVWAILLTASFFFVQVAAAMADQTDDVFGPKFCKAVKKNLEPITYTFEGEGNATLRVVPYKDNRTTAEVILNSEKVFSGKVSGENLIPVTLQGENEITVKVTGKVGAIVGVSQEIPESPTTTFGCAVSDLDYNFLEGASVTMTLLDGTSETIVTGVDGFCTFPDPLPTGEWVVVTAIKGELQGSTAVKLKSPITSAWIKVSVPGPGKISGTVQTVDGLGHKAIVKNTFHSGHVSATVTDEQGNYKLVGLPLDGLCHTQAIPGGSGETRCIDFRTPTCTLPLIDYPAPDFYHHDLTNGEFLSGTCGWTCTNMAGITSQRLYFPEIPMETTRGKPTEVIPYSGMVWSGIEPPGDEINGTSSLSQAFRVWPGDENLTFKLRFVSDEYNHQVLWPVDFFSVRLYPEDGEEKVLLEGSVLTFPKGDPVPGSYYNSDLQEVKIPMKAYEGKGVALTVSSTNKNPYFPSFVAVDDFKIEKHPEWMELGSGFWSMPTSFSVQAGRAIKFKIKNPHPLIGTNIRLVPNNNLGKSKEIILLPRQDIEWVFRNRGDEPQLWHFDVRTFSNMNNMVSWEAWSTWVPEIIE